MIDPDKMPSDRVILDDYKCVLSTYAKRTKRNLDKIDPEDNMECPLIELGLIDGVSTSSKNKVYRKVNPSADSIPELIALAVIIKSANGNNEIKISSIQQDKGSFGRIFNIDTIALINLLYKLDNQGYIKVIRTAGLDIIKILTDMDFYDCIRMYYEELNA